MHNRDVENFSRIKRKIREPHTPPIPGEEPFTPFTIQKGRDMLWWKDGVSFLTAPKDDDHAVF